MGYFLHGIYPVAKESKKASILSAHMAMVRKVLRLGLPLPILVDMCYKSIGKPSQVFQIIAEACYVVFLLSDNLVFLNKV